MDDRRAPGQPTASRSGTIVASISRDIVRIYADFYGRGPTRAKTHWHEGLVVCVLQDVFTRAEQVLVEGGSFAHVRRHRQVFEDEVAPLLRAIVEAATGRQVEEFLSQVSESGVAIEAFTLGDPVRLPVR
jgi:uncharacterized protein YbcI